jgi:hypothetical protein
MRARLVLATAAMSTTAVLGAGSCGKGPTGSSAGDAGDDAAGMTESPRAPSALALRDIVGLSTHPKLDADAVSAAERGFEWSELAKLGVHRMRTDFTWSTIEPQRGVFDWTKYDRLVDEATAHGVDLLAVLDYGVTWATTAQGATDSYPPDHPQDYGAFAAAVAARYSASVHDFEIWNEPNLGFLNWPPTLNGDPAAFGALVLEATRDVLAAQTSAHVAYGATAYFAPAPGPAFVAQSFAATPGLAASLDTFAMHAYQIYPPATGPETTSPEVPLLDKVGTMSGVLAQAGAKPVPIWITEIGWPTTTEDPADAQARYTVRAVVVGALAGADRVFVYTLEDGPNPSSFPPEDAFGIASYSTFAADAGTPQDKPVAVALRALLGALGSYVVTRRLEAQPDDVWIVELASGASHAWIAWRAADGAPAASVTVPALGNVRVTHIDGTTQDDIAGGGGYALQVSGDPVIVTPR